MANRLTPAYALSDANLVNELTNLNEEMNEGGILDCYAETMSERAMFGDSGPGTQKHIDNYNEFMARLDELNKEWLRRHPPAPIVVDDEDEIPF